MIPSIFVPGHSNRGAKNWVNGKFPICFAALLPLAFASTATALPPVVSLTYTPVTVKLNGQTTWTLKVTNPNAATLTGLSFSDTAPVSFTGSPLVNNCWAGGTAGNNINVTSTGIAAATTCTLSFTALATQEGHFTDSFTVHSAQGDAVASAGINVIGPLTLSKSFSPSSIPANGTSTLTFTITNPSDNGSTLSSFSFSDTLPAGLHFGNGSLSNGCVGAQPGYTAGGSIFSVTSVTVLMPGQSCTIAVPVTGSVPGIYNNTSGPISANESGPGGTASATLVIASPPVITKSFGAGSIPLSSGTTNLTFTIANSNSVPLTGVSFTDSLPSGLVAVGLVSNSCGGSVNVVPNSIALTSGTVSGASCAVVVTVGGSTQGVKTNSVSVTSTNGGPGNTSSASVTVVAPPVISKHFSPAPIRLNSTTQLQFTITNPAANLPLTGVGFTDNLPAGLTVANGSSPQCGGTLTTSSGTSIVLSGAMLGAAGQCQFSVVVTGAVAGSYTNTTAAVTSANGGTGNTATDILVVFAPPVISKVFNPAVIPVNGTTQLQFTITNPPTNPNTLIGVSFTDTLPTGLTVANGVLNPCSGGAVTSGGTSITLAGGIIAVGQQCQFSVTVTAVAAGTYTNTTSPVTSISASGLTGNAATANLTVATPPVISKVFNPNVIGVNGTTQLHFTITNPVANTFALTGVGFTDNLSGGLTVINGTAAQCGGTLTISGGNSIVLSGATIAAGGQCQFDVTVTGAATGAYTNTTGAVTSANGGTGNTASANLTVAAPPAISKIFNPTAIAVGSTTQLQFTITNPAANTVALTGVGFNDTLPAGLTVANGTAAQCSGTLTRSGGNTIALSGATIAVGGQCQFAVTVTGTTAGAYTNTTSAVTSGNGGTGNTASANLAVAAPPVISKVFNPTAIAVGGTTQLQFTITNPAANTVALTGVGFNDTLPAGLTVANGTAAQCGGTLTRSGGNTIALSGATIAASGQCQFAVTVTGAVSGSYTNTTNAVTSANGGTGNTATASLAVAAPPVISKAFNPTAIGLNGTTQLQFTITNPAANTIALTGVGFTDNLPAGLSVANGSSAQCGGTLTTSGGTSIVLSGATIATGGQCQFALTVTAAAAGSYTNTTNAVTSANGGTGNAATASLTVSAPPVISKAFNPTAIALNGTTQLQFTITNPAANTVALAGVGFTDNLPAGLSVASGAAPQCGGTLTASGGTSIVLSGAMIAVGGQCQFAVTVTGTGAGAYTNTTGAVTSVNGGNGNTATANLTVAAPLTVSKTFSPVKIVPGGTSTASFAITNPNASLALTNVSFADSLPAGMTVATPNGLTNSCGGTVVATAGAGSINLNGGGLAGGASCTVTVNVTAAEGQYSNSVTVTATAAGANLVSAPSTAGLSVASGPVISKSFGEVSIGPLNTVNLTFNINNPNANTTLTGIAFTDSLPAGLKVASPAVVTGACDAGTITAAANTTVINLATATLAPGASCTFTVSVAATGAVQGLLTNTTGLVSDLQSPDGSAATAAVFVGDPFQVSYAANLSVGDSVFNITNTGAAGAALPSGTTASITGAICANVYAFTPDEAMVSCCSCPVTPGGLVSLSARSDLASNTLTPAVPSALVVKVIATAPVGGSCTNSAAAVNSGLVALANGVKSFGTTIHATPQAGAYGVTETPFSPATLSTGELNRLGNLCNFILANGSGFGVCRSCRLGGLGTERQ